MKLEKYVDSLPILPVLQPTSMCDDKLYYEITMRECRQQLHRDLPPTTIWGYNGQYPGPTIKAHSNIPILVCWKNELPTTHLLPVDTTVHGAFSDVPQVRTVVHLHGAVTYDSSDGYPDAWFTNDFQTVGPAFETKMYQYPNTQPATNLWYHDHAIGITRLNIYAGLAGFYEIHDQLEQSLPLPKEPYDIPLLVQDRSFNEDGSLYYPAQPEKPVEGVNPSVVAEFFGDTNLVNGKVWPYMEVEPRRYRFRILNGSNGRTYCLSLSGAIPFVQIGTDQGLLEKPVITKELVIAPAERVDVVIDFTSLAGHSLELINTAPAPFPNGDPPCEATTGRVMKWIVNQPLHRKDCSYIPPCLTRIPVYQESFASRERLLTLDMVKDRFDRELHLLDNKTWSEPISELPELGTFEIWSFINTTGDMHPIHLHLVRFQVLDRQPYNTDYFKETGIIQVTGSKCSPDLNEQGFKDTVRANPDEITRVIFWTGPYTGRYVWHCHILEHEDYEMMRPYIVIQ